MKNDFHLERSSSFHYISGNCQSTNVCQLQSSKFCILTTIIPTPLSNPLTQSLTHFPFYLIPKPLQQSSIQIFHPPHPIFVTTSKISLLIPLQRIRYPPKNTLARNVLRVTPSRGTNLVDPRIRLPETPRKFEPFEHREVQKQQGTADGGEKQCE